MQTRLRTITTTTTIYWLHLKPLLVKGTDTAIETLIVESSREKGKQVIVAPAIGTDQMELLHSLTAAEVARIWSDAR